MEGPHYYPAWGVGKGESWGTVFFLSEMALPSEFWRKGFVFLGFWGQIAILSLSSALLLLSVQGPLHSLP